MKTQTNLSYSQGDWPQRKPNLEHLTLGLPASRNEEKINVCCLPPRLWYFVMAALAN